MWNFINRNYWNTVIITLVVLVIICGISAYSRGGSESPTLLQNAVNVVLTPVKSGIAYIGNGVGGFFGDLANTKNAAEENRQLKKRITELENENAHLETFKTENDRLRNLLGFKEKTTQYESVACEVVGRSLSSWNTTFVVNKGINDGVDVGSIIIENGGLVGRVVLAGNNWAKVSTLLDIESSVSATAIRSGAYGIVEGDIKLSNDNMCKFEFTEKDADIAIGDVIETSGLGQMFPQGIIIGKVKTVEQVSGEIERRITVELSADINNLCEVLAIKTY